MKRPVTPLESKQNSFDSKTVNPTFLALVTSFVLLTASVESVSAQVTYPDTATITVASDVLFWDYETREDASVHGPDMAPWFRVVGDSIHLQFGEYESGIVYSSSTLDGFSSSATRRMVASGAGARYYKGTNDPNPGNFDNKIWPGVTGMDVAGSVSGTLYRIGYQEFQAWTVPVEDRTSANNLPSYTCPDPSTTTLEDGLEKCWYNGFVLLKSTDNGETWGLAGEDPTQYVVASSPYKFQEQSNTGRHGVFPGAHGLVEVDGYYYFPVEVWGEGFKIPTMMRTDNITDAQSWRYWDGEGFTLPNLNPYVEVIADPASSLPAVFDAEGAATINPTGAPVTGLDYSSYFDAYIRIATRAFNANPEVEPGIYFQLSKDGFQWSGPQMLYPLDYATSMNAGVKLGGRSENFAYPSLVGAGLPASTAIGQNAYLYYVTFDPSNSGLPDRDIRRVPVTFNTHQVSGFTVTHSGSDISLDPEDPNPGDGYCDNGYGECTLITAITESEARLPWLADTVGLTITFNSSVGSLVEDYAPRITKKTRVDGTAHSSFVASSRSPMEGSWTGTLPVIIPNGLNITAGHGHVVKGIKVSSMTLGSPEDSVSATLTGSRIDTLSVYTAGTSGLQIGGTSAAEANVIGQITLNGNEAQVKGNWIGVDGEFKIVADDVAAVTIFGSNNTLSGNVIGGSSSYRLVNMTGSSAAGNLLENNYIGTKPWDANSAEYGSGAAAIALIEAPFNTIKANTISWNNTGGQESAIYVLDSDDNLIINNTVSNNTGNGVQVTGTSTRTKIGSGVTSGNAIHNNTGYGVSFSSSTVTGNPVVGNLIYSNSNGSIGQYDQFDATPVPIFYSAYQDVSTGFVTVKYRGYADYGSEEFDFDVFSNPEGTTDAESRTILATGVNIQSPGDSSFFFYYTRSLSEVLTMTTTDDRSVTSNYSMPRSIHTTDSTSVAALDSTGISLIHMRPGQAEDITVNLSNSGQADLEWVVKETFPWAIIETDSLILAPSGSQPVTISFNTTQLSTSQSVYRDTLEFYTNEAGTPLAGLPLQVTFYDSSAVELDTDSLKATLTIPTKDTTATLTFKIVRKAPVPFSYSVTKTQPFVQGISPVSGTLTSDTTSISVTVHLKANQIPGTVSDMLVARWWYGSQSPEIIELPTSVTYEAASGGGGGGGGGDTVAPTVVIAPANGSKDVSKDTVITFTFSEPVRKQDDSQITGTNIQSLIALRDSTPSGTTIPFTALINTEKTVITLTPGSAFRPGQTVFVAVSQVEDMAGNALAVSPATSSTFTVKADSQPQPSFTKGDVDEDGQILAYDAALILQYSVGKDPLPEIDPIPWENERIAAADVDESGEVLALDAVYVLQYNVGIITEFPKNAPPKSATPTVTVALAGDSLVFSTQSSGLYGLNVDIPVMPALSFSDPVILPIPNLLSTFNRTNEALKIGLANPYEMKGTLMKVPFAFVESSGTSGSASADSATVAILLRENNGKRTIEVPIRRQSTSNEDIEAVPTGFSLMQNYPNPFNPSTEIQFGLPVASQVVLEVHSLLGQRVAVLVDGVMSAGTHKVSFDASDLTTGVYLYTITTPEFTQTKKMMLLK